jgi:hypothetical protein
LGARFFFDCVVVFLAPLASTFVGFLAAPGSLASHLPVLVVELILAALYLPEKLLAVLVVKRRVPAEQNKHHLR